MSEQKEDKKFIISCPLKTNTSYIISKGGVFQDKHTYGCRERYLLPFCIPKVITPRFVQKIILWAIQGKHAVMVAWNIRNFPV